MKTASYLALAILSVTAALPAFADLHLGNAPKVDIGATVQTGTVSGVRGLIRVSYDGLGSSKDDSYYLAVSAKVAVSAEGELTYLDFDFVPFHTRRYTGVVETDEPGLVRGWSIGTANISRNVALGKSLKARIDFIGVSAEWSGSSEGIAQLFLSASVNALGMQYLKHQSESGEVAQAGVDFAGAKLEAGALKRWTSGFSTRLAIGGSTDTAIFATGGPDDGTLKISPAIEARAYARLSALIDSGLGSFELYSEVSAAALKSISDTANSETRIEGGMLRRF